jgi:DNA-binding IclR family transcriptional regulator
MFVERDKLPRMGRTTDSQPIAQPIAQPTPEPLVRTDVGVVDKVSAVLGALEQSPCSLSELAAATGFHRATAHRLATSLEVHGLVRRDDTGRFALGSRLIRLGRLAGDGLPLRDVARAALTRLVAATGESAQLYVRDGNTRVCVDALESAFGLRTIVSVGAVLALDKGSAGKVLSGVVLSGVGNGEWAQSVGEREAGVASVSAPVRDRDGAVRAAVSVSGPIERTTRQPGRRYADAVCAAAREIEAAAGWGSVG